MPDISMCSWTYSGTNHTLVCPIKDSCYRHTVTPTPDPGWQSWFLYPPYSIDKKECEFWWDNGSDKVA